MKIFCDISVCCCFLFFFVFVFFVYVCVLFLFFVFFWGGEGLGGWWEQGSASAIFSLCLTIQSIKHQVPFHVVV